MQPLFHIYAKFLWRFARKLAENALEAYLRCEAAFSGYFGIRFVGRKQQMLRFLNSERINEGFEIQSGQRVEAI